jgi:hypothetical protein
LGDTPCPELVVSPESGPNATMLYCGAASAGATAAAAKEITHDIASARVLPMISPALN